LRAKYRPQIIELRSEIVRLKEAAALASGTWNNSFFNSNAVRPCPSSLWQKKKTQNSHGKTASPAESV
jgi:hypothetical protein